MSDATKPPEGYVHDGLRLGLLNLWTRRGDEGLAILSVSSGVSKRSWMATTLLCRRSSEPHWRCCNEFAI